MPLLDGHSVESRHLEKPINIEEAYKKSSELFEKKALKPESFVGKGKFSAAEVESDLKYVENRKKGFTNTEGEEYKLAKCMEAVIFEAVNNAEWFGKNAKMVIPSEYDDLHNGVDGVIEFHKENQPQSYLGLALDVTYSQLPTKKFQIIKEQIDESRLGKVKYFRSSDGSVEKPLDHLPRAVVMMNAADTTRLVGNWHSGSSAKESPYRDLILYQIFIQLKKFQEYSGGKPELAAHFQGALQNIGALLAKNLTPQKLKELNQHPSVKIIQEMLSHFNREQKS